MSIVKDGLQGVVEGIGKGLDGLFTSDEERGKVMNSTLKILTEPHRLQAINNIQDAKAASFWQSGWRPAIGWTCATGLFYHFIVREWIVFAMVAARNMGNTEAERMIGYLPTMDSGQLISLTMALLGLGGLRTWEKYKGINKK